jgi:CheY-like chemotaxis protein
MNPLQVVSLGCGGERRPLRDHLADAPLEPLGNTLRVLSKVLATQGAIVTAVDNAREALRLADEDTFDPVISDIGMPEMDGLQMIAELRRRERSARWPAIAVSGFGQPSDRDRAKAAGYNDHLTKPLSMESLHEAFARLSRRSARGQRYSKD